jgi:hypothetical protein
MRENPKGKVVGYIKTRGTQLLNGDGEVIRLRGVGLGGWLLPEGYMWKFPEQGDRPWKMEHYIESCIGKVEADEFWRQYRLNFMTESDIRQIKEEGFNSIRLPFNARLLIEEEGYRESEMFYIDRVIDWCEDYGLYVILDMHGVLGGQTGTNIDDSLEDQPDYFKERTYQVATVNLWRFIANRYKDRWIVAGYDLMNEPLPNWFATYNKLLMPLYREIIEAIREVDQQHMIILEGVHWSTDWSIFDEILDSNVLYQFHKYWNNPDQDSIKTYLDFRETHQVPIFMGEGGENNKEWYMGAFSMFEDLDISWNFWTYKKMDNNNSLCSITIPYHWDILADNLSKGIVTPKKEAKRILNDFLNKIKFEACTYYQDVADALLCRVPIELPAIFYSNTGKDLGYHMVEAYDSRINFRKSDQTYIESISSDVDHINFANSGGEGWSTSDRTTIRLRETEWLSYTIYVSEVGSYLVNVSAKSSVPISHLEILVTNHFEEAIDIRGDYIKTYALKSCIALKEGHHTITIRLAKGSAFIEWISVRAENNPPTR